MTPTRSVLLTTDLTPLSDRAFERALRLTGPGDVLTILHVVESDPLDAGADRECRIAEDRLNELLKAHDAEGRRAEFVVRMGEPAVEIVSQARQRGAGLVVLGAHRKSLLGDLFLSPTAQLVIDEAVAPALTVKDPVADDYRTVVVGVDGSPACVRALVTALDMFPDARVVVVQAFHVPFGAFLDTPDNRRDFANEDRAELEAVVRQAAQRRADPAGRIESFLREGETAQVLQSEVARSGADLLVIGTSGRGGGPFGSVAKALSMDPPCDLLVVPTKERPDR